MGFCFRQTPRIAKGNNGVKMHLLTTVVAIRCDRSLSLKGSASYASGGVGESGRLHTRYTMEKRQDKPLLLLYF